jgi:tetratricopeptide (TPR) repeat protein
MEQDRPGIFNNRSWHLALLVILVAVAAVYGQVAAFDFVLYDDNRYLQENPALQEGLTPQSAWWALTTSYQALWAPLTWLSHALDVSLFGFRPGPHHLVNVLLHLLNTLLLAVVFRRLTGRAGAALALAAIFALHPLRVESVAWVAERKDVLCALFGLLCLYAYDRYARSRNDNWLFGALAAFVLGLLSKPMLVTLPFVLLLLDVWPYGRTHGERWTVAARLVGEKAPFFILIAFVCYITVGAQQEAIVSMETVPFWPRLAGTLRNYWGYVHKSLLPYPLATPYVLQPVYLLTPEILAKGAGLLALTAGAFGLRRRAPYVLVGWLWFLGMLVPVIGLVQIGHHAMADRFSYLPHLGLGMAVVLGAGDLLQKRPRAALAMTVLVATVFSVLSFRQVGVWRNSETLFSHAIRHTDNNYVAHNNLAEYYVSQGRFTDAAEEYEQTLRLNPGEVNARYNYGSVLVAVERYREAVAVLRQVEPSFPDDSPLQVNLALAYLNLGEIPAAIKAVEQALRLDPASEKARECLQLIQESEQRPPAAP